MKPSPRFPWTELISCPSSFKNLFHQPNINEFDAAALGSSFRDKLRLMNSCLTMTVDYFLFWWFIHWFSCFLVTLSNDIFIETCSYRCSWRIWGLESWWDVSFVFDQFDSFDLLFRAEELHHREDRITELEEEAAMKSFKLSKFFKIHQRNCWGRERYVVFNTLTI